MAPYAQQDFLAFVPRVPLFL